MTKLSRVAGLLAALALTAGIATPTAAKTTTYSYECEDHLVAVTDPGTAWVEEGALHIRGWTGVYHTVGDDHCAGVMTAVANFNLDLATWSGGLWGTQSVELNAFDGGYSGTFTAHWTASDPLAPDAEDIWVGKYVMRGFGELEGWKTRGNLVEKTHLLIIDEGYAFEPGS